MGCLRCLSRAKSFHVKIILLDKQELIQEIQEKTTGQDLLDNIFKYLNLIETAYFGLRYQDSANQTHWIDPGKRVSTQIRGIVPVTLYLGVKFYAADPSRLVEEITRYQFFLQVKEDILQGRLPVSQELAVELAALALQSELGDYDPGRHSPGYVSEFRFFATQTEEMEAEIESVHASMSGLGVVPSNAEMTYLEKVKWLDMYGVDLHPVIGEDNIEYFLGLTPSGIIVLRNRSKVGNYFWPRITKIYFKGKYFMLRVRDKNNEDGTYGFETPSRQACKHLWKCCVEHHAFFRLVQVSPTSGGSGVFSLGSRFRYSGETEKQVLQQVQSVRRPPPKFTRRPSKRYSRRSNSNGHDDANHGDDVDHDVGNGLNPQQQQTNKEMSSNHVWEKNKQFAATNGSLKRPSSSAANHKYNRILSTTNSLPRHISLVMTSPNAGSMPDGSSRQDPPPESLQDLSLQSLQWLESRGISSNRRSSLSEQVHASQSHQRRSSRKMSSGTAGQSDNESEASGVSWASGLASNRKRAESGSESERSVRRTHRSRRKRQGSYKLIESDDQWQAIQQRQHHRSRPHSSHGPRDQASVQEATIRKSGYMNSGAETEADLASVASNLRRNRRRARSRSRSPGESRARLPQEVVKHLEFSLVEPSAESIRGEIPFTNVQTSVTRPIMTAKLHQQARRSTGSNSQQQQQIETASVGGRGPRTTPHVFPANNAISTMPRRHPVASTPSGSPRTTVSELSGMESQQRVYSTNTPDLRERLAHNLVHASRQYPPSQSTPTMSFNNGNSSSENRQTPISYAASPMMSYSPRVPNLHYPQNHHQQQQHQQQAQYQQQAQHQQQQQQHHPYYPPPPPPPPLEPSSRFHHNNNATPQQQQQHHNNRVGIPMIPDSYQSPYLTSTNGFSASNQLKRFNNNNDDDDHLPLPPPPPLPPGAGEMKNGSGNVSYGDQHHHHQQKQHQSDNQMGTPKFAQKFTLPPTVLTSYEKQSPYGQSMDSNGFNKHPGYSYQQQHQHILPIGDEMSTEL